jgi:hypothetical protein
MRRFRPDNRKYVGNQTCGKTSDNHSNHFSPPSVLNATGYTEVGVQTHVAKITAAISRFKLRNNYEAKTLKRSV